MPEVFTMTNEDVPAFDAAEARKQNLVGKRIAAIRKARKLTQADVCEALQRDHHISLQPAAISRWEHGVTEPSAKEFLALYDVFELKPSFRFLEDDIRPLEIHTSAANARFIRNFVRYLKENHVYDSKRKNIRPVTLPLLVPISRGLQSKDSGPYTYSQITVKETQVPFGTDFALQMQDSSMHPLIPLHGLAFCSFARDLTPADVGVFVYRHQVIVRSYYTYEGNAIPIALYPANLDYPIEPIDFASQLTIIGRVLV